MRVLGVDVGEELVGRWRSWLMPERQPFVVPDQVADDLGGQAGREALSFELLDSFELYGTPPGHTVVHLTRLLARRLPAAVRRAQPAAHRWPSADPELDRARTLRYVERGRRASRQREVPEDVWAVGADLLPGARRLAGTFADGSGPNCFGTVMAAAGVIGAEREWVQLEPFDAWLDGATVPGGRDDDPGTVLVWRTASGAPAHAALTLGGGWLLHKPSQGWMSPRTVLAVREGMLAARYPGQRVSRRRLA